VPAAQRFGDRVAIVTGGAAGIGYATAKAYARLGATVVIADVDEAKLEAVKAELGVDGIAGDLSQEVDAERLVSYAVERHGKVDILVNLASIYPPGPVEQETVEGWRRVIGINLDSTFLCTQKVLPHMRERGYGRIVNTSSSTFNNGQPGMVAYVTSKGGVVAFSRVVATEVGEHGITVNTIMPGLIATQHVLDMFGGDPTARQANDEFFDVAIAQQAVKRRGEPEDIANGILFLTDEASGFISGQVLQVDGGWSFTA